MRAQQESYKTCFFASIWSCFTDPTGQNINHYLTLLDHNTGNVCIPTKCVTYLLCCLHGREGSLHSLQMVCWTSGSWQQVFPFSQKVDFCCLQPTEAIFHLNVVDRSQELVIKKWEKHLDPLKMLLEALKRSLECLKWFFLIDNRGRRVTPRRCWRRRLL